VKHIDKNILIWGAGKLGACFSYYFGKTENILGFVETKKTKNTYLGYPVFSIKDISKKEYDYLVVANVYEYECREIIYELNIDASKVVYINYKKLPVEVINNTVYVDWNRINNCNNIDSTVVAFYPFGLQTTSKDIYELLVSKNGSFWENETFIPAVEVPEIFENTKKFIENYFLPLLNKTENIYDIGCGDGSMDRLLAFGVNRIIGTDLSIKNINIAKKVSEEQGFTNLEFMCDDISTVDYEEKYDNYMCLGVLLYMNELEKIVRSVARNIKTNGYFLVRNPLSLNGCSVYMHRYEDNYNCCYHDMKMFEKVFEQCGFTLKEKQRIIHYGIEPFMLGQYIYIYQKN